MKSKGWREGSEEGGKGRIRGSKRFHENHRKQIYSSTHLLLVLQ